MTHPSHEILNDYVDAQLPEADRTSVEGHLGQCAECTHIVDQLRALLDRAAALRDIEPSRDLFPGIRGAVSKRPMRWLQWAGAAAALIVVVVMRRPARSRGAARPYARRRPRWHQR